MIGTVLMFILVAVVKLEGAEIDCERIEHFKTKKCCFLDKLTVIKEVNLTFSGLENPDVETIFFSGNKKIEFLPVNVYKKFPNLKSYYAGEASIKEISTLNFAKLTKVKRLDLFGNQIEFIPDDCFQGLLKLRKIDLSKRFFFGYNHLTKIF